jgi:predicted amidohydrolase YtcJ
LRGNEDVIARLQMVSRASCRALTVCVALFAAGLTGTSRAQGSCPGGEDWVLRNGTILTMDAEGRTVSTVRIRGERIIAVDEALVRDAPCVRVIDLDGRTVIPGLIDSHTHFVRTAQAPGPFITGLESATSIRELQRALATAAEKAEPGEWIASIGGFTPNQFAERRLPTRAELSTAVPAHPVYMQVGYSGKGITNDVGRRVLEDAGIQVPDDGIVTAGGAILTFVLRSTNDERMQRRFHDYMAYAMSLGLTTVVDLCVLPVARRTVVGRRAAQHAHRGCAVALGRAAVTLAHPI